MKSFILAASTILAWTYGIAIMVVAFSGSAVERALGRVYPVVVLLLVASFIVYIIDPFRNPRVPQEKRTLWVVALVFGHWFVQPFYWWWYLRRGNT